MSRNELKGSITVEAALLVPLTVLLTVPFLMLLRMLLLSFMLENQLQSALTELATVSYVMEAGEMEAGSGQKKKTPVENAEEKEAAYESLRDLIKGLFSETPSEDTEEDILLDEAGQLYLYARLLDQWSSEGLSDWGVEGGAAGLSLDGSRFFYKDNGHSYLMRAELEITWQSPVSFWTPKPWKIVRVTHAFWGEKDSASSSWTAASAEEDSETVYRIGKGTHYHHGGCYLIDKNVSSITYEQAVSRELSPCSLCGGGTETVYISSGGDRFHQKGCSILFPDLQEMTVEEAVAAGLTPCGLCFSDEDYFQR